MRPERVLLLLQSIANAIKRRQKPIFGFKGMGPGWSPQISSVLYLLFLLHLFPSTLPLFMEQRVNAIQIAAIILVSFIAVSVISKGIVPVIICILGIVLIHNSLILPYYSEPQPGEASFGEVKFRWTLVHPHCCQHGCRHELFSRSINGCLQYYNRLPALFTVYQK